MTAKNIISFYIFYFVLYVKSYVCSVWSLRSIVVVWIVTLNRFICKYNWKVVKTKKFYFKTKCTSVDDHIKSKNIWPFGTKQNPTDLEWIFIHALTHDQRSIAKACHLKIRSVFSRAPIVAKSLNEPAYKHLTEMFM